MNDLPLSCDLPETDIEQELEKRWYRTQGERLASPPAQKVSGVSDSTEGMSHHFAHVTERFLDIRTGFMVLRGGQLIVINAFMITILLFVWFIDLFFSGVFLATSAFLLPIWASVYFLELLCPLTLPVRIDRKEQYVYVGHRGTFYRIPLNDFEVSFSHNLQYLGSGVVWKAQYYCHVYLREKYYFCGKPPKRSLQRKKLFSGFKEKEMYRKWNVMVRYCEGGSIFEDVSNLHMMNYGVYLANSSSKSSRVLILDHFFFFLFMTNFMWWKYTPLKFKWPAEIESIFGKANYY